MTGISIDALRGRKLNQISVEERMSWAAGRTTTLKEDKVYCLLGIFGVFLSPIYGEGEEYATLRLKEEIHKRRQGHSMTDLQDVPGASSLIETLSFSVSAPPLTKHSLVSATFPTQRALCRARNPTSDDQSEATLAKFPSTYDDIWTWGLWKISTCS